MHGPARVQPTRPHQLLRCSTTTTPGISHLSLPAAPPPPTPGNHRSIDLKHRYHSPPAGAKQKELSDCCSTPRSMGDPPPGRNLQIVACCRFALPPGAEILCKPLLPRHQPSVLRHPCSCPPSDEAHDRFGPDSWVITGIVSGEPSSLLSTATRHQVPCGHDFPLRIQWAKGGNSLAAGLETAEPAARRPILGTNAPGANALAEPTRARRAAVLRILQVKKVVKYISRPTSSRSPRQHTTPFSFLLYVKYETFRRLVL